MGDALIAATCLEQDYNLATANIGDFGWIEELKALAIGPDELSREP